MSNYQNFTEMKQFVGFNSEDIENLKAMAPIFEGRGAAITDIFYATLSLYPATAALFEGWVDHKATHRRWMMEVFNGVEGGYDEAYYRKL
ncbi:MAG: protoglobin domain-containing protein [Verrucomicrobiales bacterium]|nr:protoglobin domain-containing protein [Verrucomicrobiales bacterium]